MTSHSGQQIITVHIFSNISRSKGKQTTKLGQLIEYNMKNICLKKSWTKCGEIASSRPFYKKLKLMISLDRQPECYKVCFCCMLKWRSTKVYLK